MISFTKKRAALGLVVLLAGGGAAAYATGIVAKPAAGLLDRGDWVTDGELKVRSSAYVHNPNPVRLNLSTLEASYRLEMNSITLASGTRSGLFIPRNENRTLEFTTDLRTGNVPAWWVSHLENSETSRLEVPVTASVKIGPVPLSYGGYSYTDTISTDIESKLSESISRIEGSYSRQLGALEATEFEVEITDASARFGDVDGEVTELVIPLTVRNPNSYPMPTPQFSGELEMNDVRLAAFDANNVRTASDASIPPGESREVTVLAQMSNEKLDDWFVSHARNAEKTDARLDVRLAFDVQGATVTVPEDGMTCRFSFATMILVDEKAPVEGFRGCEGMSPGQQNTQEDSGDGPVDDGSNDTTDSDGTVGGLL